MSVCLITFSLLREHHFSELRKAVFVFDFLCCEIRVGCRESVLICIKFVDKLTYLPAIHGVQVAILLPHAAAGDALCEFRHYSGKLAESISHFRVRCVHNGVRLHTTIVKEAASLPHIGFGPVPSCYGLALFSAISFI